MLNAEGRFGIPALSPALFNVVAIVWAGALWGMGLSVEQVVLVSSAPESPGPHTLAQSRADGRDIENRGAHAISSPLTVQ